ncbi:hypothetical protein BAXH7_03801 [Bacillus amyloliquefaciens XH7]|nr:hypothetical protein LL3_03813 [Bacillus amyloliquefaciens LL3]AEK90911.1 hypothetical protein BAXH7_03801 [Bacillus amyloliquefaciens XH7]KYC98933.1 hypothetical protein B425_3401 [Bacillus amyloliquefaciens]
MVKRLFKKKITNREFLQKESGCSPSNNFYHLTFHEVKGVVTACIVSV